MDRGRHGLWKSAIAGWLVIAFAGCSEKARDIGGESHFACASDDDCDVDSVCVRDGSSSRGECRPIRGVGGSGGTGGEAPHTGGAGTGAQNDVSGGRSNGGSSPDASTGGSSGTRASTTGGVGGADSGAADSGASNAGVSGTDSGGADAGACETCARGAVTLKVGVAPGKICSHTVGQISMPRNVAGVIQALNCDLSEGCHPDEYVVVDRDRGATVACSVSPNGGSFNVSISLAVNGASTGDTSLQLQATGVLSPTGGTVSIAEFNSVAQGGGTDNACTLAVNAPHGALAAGKIWASVHCENFRDQTDISETGCILDSVFLFENCSP